LKPQALTPAAKAAPEPTAAAEAQRSNAVLTGGAIAAQAYLQATAQAATAPTGMHPRPLGR